MELVLNLVWVLTAIGIFGAYGAWAARAPKGVVSQRRKRHIGLALVCVVALLFPIISMTDDMATDAAALAEWTSARRTALIVASVVLNAILCAVTPVAVMVAQPGRSVHLACVGLVAIALLSILSPSITTVWSFRAPPLPRS
jgi:hypothetical protein